jgi:hypothetical protein
VGASEVLDVETGRGALDADVAPRNIEISHHDVTASLSADDRGAVVHAHVLTGARATDDAQYEFGVRVVRGGPYWWRLGSGSAEARYLDAFEPSRSNLELLPVSEHRFHDSLAAHPHAVAARKVKELESVLRGQDTSVLA